MFRALCAHRQEVKIVLYSLWYHHTEISEWSKITIIYKYEHIVKFMCEFFGCDYRLLLTINRGCIIQFWPPDDEHMVLETCRSMK